MAVDSTSAPPVFACNWGDGSTLTPVAVDVDEAVGWGWYSKEATPSRWDSQARGMEGSDHVRHVGSVHGKYGQLLSRSSII